MEETWFGTFHVYWVLELLIMMSLIFFFLEKEKQLPVLGAAVALYQWKARNDNELSFSKGDTIEILEQLEMRWKVWY